MTGAGAQAASTEVFAARLPICASRVGGAIVDIPVMFMPR